MALNSREKLFPSCKSKRVSLFLPFSVVGSNPRTCTYSAHQATPPVLQNLLIGCISYKVTPPALVMGSRKQDLSWQIGRGIRRSAVEEEEPGAQTVQTGREGLHTLGHSP